LQNFEKKSVKFSVVGSYTLIVAPPGVKFEEWTKARFWGQASFTQCTGKEKDFELISTVKMETTLPVEGSFGNKFSSNYNHCGVMAA